MTRTAAVLVALLVVAAGSSVATTVGATTDESASFDDNYVEVTRGETAAITVTVTGSNSAEVNLTIGSEEDGFEVVVPLGGSGTHTVEFDTYHSTSSNPNDFLSVNGATMETPPLDDAIEDGQYDLEVTIDGVQEAVGNLEVTPREETTGEPGVLPADVDLDEVDADDVFDRLTVRDNVARGDYAAFVVNESGLEGAFGDDPTSASLADEGLEMRVDELDPEPNTEAESHEGGDLKVVAQVEDGDRFVVLWDTGDVDLGAGSNHTHELRLSLDASNPLVDSEETLVRERVTLADPSVRLDADPGLTLPPWEGERMRVNGSTNLAPTTSLDVRALQDAPQDYLWKDVVAVSGDGTFATTFDFTPAERPGSFPLWVLGYEDETEHTVRLPAANASLQLPAQAVRDDAVTLEDVDLTAGGFVRLTANDTTVGVTDHLDAGSRESLTVALNESLDGPTNVTATAVVDVNENGELDEDDRVYGSWGTPVEDTAVVRPADEQTETTRTTDQTTSPTTSRSTTATTSEQTTILVREGEPLQPAASNDGGSSSGFVPLSPATTLVALAAAVLLALCGGPDRL